MTTQATFITEVNDAWESLFNDYKKILSYTDFEDVAKWKKTLESAQATVENKLKPHSIAIQKRDDLYATKVTKSNCMESEMSSLAKDWKVAINKLQEILSEDKLEFQEWSFLSQQSLKSGVDGRTYILKILPSRDDALKLNSLIIRSQESMSKEDNNAIILAKKLSTDIEDLHAKLKIARNVISLIKMLSYVFKGEYDKVTDFPDVEQLAMAFKSFEAQLK